MKIMNVKGTVDSLPSKEIIRRKLIFQKAPNFRGFFLCQNKNIGKC